MSERRERIIDTVSERIIDTVSAAHWRHHFDCHREPVDGIVVPK